MKIGLTGQIGAGKSSASEIFRSLGAQIVNADEIGKEVVEHSLPLRKKLAEAFGRSILDRQGNIRRAQLAKLAFASEETTEKLNSLVHPHLLKRIRSDIAKAAKTRKVIIVDAALLVAWGLHKEMDLVVMIAAPEKLRMKRMAARGISLEDAKARQAAQPSVDRMREAANVIIDNTGTSVDLAGKLVQVWSRYVIPRLLVTPARKKARADQFDPDV